IVVEMAMQDVELVRPLAHLFEHHDVQRIGIPDRAVETQRTRPRRFELCRRDGIATGIQGYLMTERDEFLGQPVHDALGPAVELWWNSLGKWRDLRNPHDRLPHGCLDCRKLVAPCTAKAGSQRNKSRTAKSFRVLFLCGAGTNHHVCSRLQISRKNPGL